MIKKIALILVLAAAVLAIVISRQPSEFHVSRSAAMSAPAVVVFNQVNNLHNWHTWSPWAKLDPDGKESFEGPSAGAGAVMHWSGNMKVGEGSMTITQSHPNDLVHFRLDFLKPFKATNTAEFTFQPQGNQTLVTWTMSGQNNFISKAIGLVMNCDKMVGGQFELGLANLKAVVEAAPHK